MEKSAAFAPVRRMICYSAAGMEEIAGEQSGNIKRRTPSKTSYYNARTSNTNQSLSICRGDYEDLLFRNEEENHSADT